jgi:hypothetical protein
MSNIKNPSAYWNNAHKSSKNQQLNIDLEYFISNPFSTEQKVFKVIESINYLGTQFQYVTEYQPYNNALKSLPNLIIDRENQKLILIPSFTSIDNARTFNDPNYIQFKRFIERNFNNIPTEDFINFINSDRLKFTYVANNFNQIITNCEKKNSITIGINPMDYKFNCTISAPKLVKSVYVAPHLREVPPIVTAPVPKPIVVAPALKPIVVAPALKPISKPIVVAPLLKPISKAIEEAAIKSPAEIWSEIGSAELMQEFIKEDKCGKYISKDAIPTPAPVSILNDTIVTKTNAAIHSVGGSTKEVSKPNFINFFDPKLSKLKDAVISELSGNPTDEKLAWLNNLFHNIFMYPDFLQLVTKNNYLIIDSENQKLIRKKFNVKNIYNPEEID